MSYKYSDYECGSCYWLRDMQNDNIMFDGPANEKGHCIMQKSCYYPDDNICSYYRDKKSYVPGGGCFITTIISDMLGFDDKCDILNTLRDFRNNIMQKNPEYKEILFEYDTIGPEIAKSIRDEADYELINGIVDFYILPTVGFIKEKKYKEAVSKYITMTKSLEKYYGINTSIEIPNNYDYTQGGHGCKKITISNAKNLMF